MAKTIPKTLTQNAVSKMFEAASESENVVVQLTSIQKKQNFYLCSVSDGSYAIRAVIPLEFELNINTDLYAIINIKSHATNSKGIVLTDFEKLKELPKQIGSPIDFIHAKENDINNVGTNVIEAEIKDLNIDKVKKEHKEEKKELTPTQIKKEAQTAKNKTDQTHSSNETVSSLYVGVSNWMIVCRILKCDYRQYENKKKKLTQQLSLQLIDRSNVKINGKIFGEAALKFHALLKENSVYQISKGRVVEGNYNDSKTKLFSPYQILFNDNSCFNEVSDVNLIAKSQTLIQNLGEVVEERVFSHELDVAAILISIQGEVELARKDNTGTVLKRNVVICDPEAKISMNATFWGKDAVLDSSLIGKTVVLSHLKLKEYLESLSLNSNPGSTMKALPNHRFSKYEGKIHIDEYQMISNKRKEENTDNGEVCFNIKDLQSRVNLMNSGDSVISELDVYVSRLATHRKWYYDGCNKCQKGVEPMSKCEKCNLLVEVPSPHYSIGVQLSDAYGSFWTTAMDDLALRIFQVNINELKKLNEDQLSNQADKYLFKEFKLKIKTIKDAQNRIKHNVSRICELSQVKITKNILQLIKTKI